MSIPVNVSYAIALIRPINPILGELGLFPWGYYVNSYQGELFSRTRNTNSFLSLVNWGHCPGDIMSIPAKMSCAIGLGRPSQSHP
jgi:hypothetical protein